ncbi:MAG TPA: YfhO family protein [Saprospiraceae bacterium]|nr:YfhO family protein [Saprospiraceae bacterium]
MKKTALNRILPHLAALLIFTGISAIYFLPQIQGEVLPPGDIVHNIGMSHEVVEYEKQTGEVSHWTNSIFCGMPTYQISSPVKSNLVKYVESASNLFIERPIGYFIALMLGMYILLQVLGASQWLSIIGAVAFGLVTNNFILFEAGHMSKLRTLAFSPTIVAGMILAYRGKLFWGGILFAISLAVNIYANHPQMTYYLAMTLVIYVIWQLVQDAKNGRILDFAKASGILLIGALLAVGASYSKIASTLEYSKDTMRGKPILETKGEVTSSSQVEGLEWNYAMQWSNGFLDLFASFIPGVVGGGSQEPVGKDAAITKFMRSSNDVKAPLYWGDLPFTSGPAYFGASLFFLFLLGLFLVKGQLKWWIAIATLFTFLLSMGKHFEILNRLFFEYFPLYNNFRAHNSVLTITAIFIPVLGILALSNILNHKVNKQEVTRALAIGGGISALICLFFAFVGPGFFDFSSPGDAQYQQAASALVSDRKDLMRSDALRTLLIVLLLAGLIWAYVNEKIKSTILLFGIGLVALFDLWTVGKRYLDDNNFISKTEYNKTFQPRPVDKQILEDQTLYYRVLDFSVNTFNSAIPSYFHKTIGGYNAAKLQRYQDMIDYHILKNNQAVFNMLNTRYVITEDEQLQRNYNALGNAWFVKDVKMVNTPNEEIESLTGFTPTETAVVLNEFKDYLGTFQSSTGEGSIMLTEYKPNKLTYTSETQAEQLAVFSEIWYGPNKGWQAYVDGKPAEHIRADYCLRAMKIPAGKHTIVFEFKPESFARGETISYISSGLLMLAFLGMIGYGGWKWYEQLPEEEAVPEKKEVKKTQPKRKK